MQVMLVAEHSVHPTGSLRITLYKSTREQRSGRNPDAGYYVVTKSLGIVQLLCSSASRAHIGLSSATPSLEVHRKYT